MGTRQGIGNIISCSLVVELLGGNANETNEEKFQAQGGDKGEGGAGSVIWHVPTRFFMRPYITV